MSSAARGAARERQICATSGRLTPATMTKLGGAAARHVLTGMLTTWRAAAHLIVCGYVDSSGHDPVPHTPKVSSLGVPRRIDPTPGSTIYTSRCRADTS